MIRCDDNFLIIQLVQMAYRFLNNCVSTVNGQSLWDTTKINFICDNLRNHLFKYKAKLGLPIRTFMKEKLMRKKMYSPSSWPKINPETIKMMRYLWNNFKTDSCKVNTWIVLISHNIFNYQHKYVWYAFRDWNCQSDFVYRRIF